jgi:transmembrane sensor
MTRATEISDAAAEWLIRLESQTSPDLWDAFQAWHDADLRHRAAFVRLRVAWNRTDLMKNLRPADGTIDPDLLTHKWLSSSAVADHGLSPLQGRRRKRPGGLPPPGRRALLGAAALLAAVAVIAWFSAEPTSWQSYDTDIGARRQVVLRDGSTLELNTNTQLRTRISSARRDIRLDRGEALFQVAHDPARPFYVMAAGTVIQAVGTEFSVRIRDAGHVDVLVSEGRVAVGAAGSGNSENPTISASAAQVGQSEAASAVGSTVTVRRLPTSDLTRKLAWTAGHLAFQGETLEEAVREFNRYNQRQLAIADPAIARLQVGGTFLTTDPDSFVAALQRSFGIRARTSRKAGEILLISVNGPAG